MATSRFRLQIDELDRRRPCAGAERAEDRDSPNRSPADSVEDTTPPMCEALTTAREEAARGRPMLSYGAIGGRTCGRSNSDEAPRVCLPGGARRRRRLGALPTRRGPTLCHPRCDTPIHAPRARRWSSGASARRPTRGGSSTSSAMASTTSAATRATRTTRPAGASSRSRACASCASRTASRSTWCSFRRCRRPRSIACQQQHAANPQRTRPAARPSCSARIPSASRRSTRSAPSSATAPTAGIPAAKYNMNLLGVLRTPDTPGRGGSHYSTWRLREAKEDPPLTAAGVVSRGHGLGAHHVLPRARRAGRRRSTRCAWPATRTTPACRRKASAASRACWAPSTA